jgi:hypothetical protein
VSVPVRVVTLLVAFVIVVVGAVFVVSHYFVGNLPTVDYVPAAHNGVVNVVLQEDPQNNSTSKPDWVSYYVMKPGANPDLASSWVHTTLFSVPADTRVNMTIRGFDGCTPLRNNFWSLVQGTIGGVMAFQQFKDVGKPMGPVHITSTLNSWAHCDVGHTFAIPSLHVFVPVGSPDASASLCGVSPCTSGPFALEKFSFRTPDHGGAFRWQCFIPCGGGFVDGNGGPMQTIGFMMGQMTVVPQ